VLFAEEVFVQELESVMLLFTRQEALFLLFRLTFSLSLAQQKTFFFDSLIIQD
jgi:hypothetical protein